LFKELNSSPLKLLEMATERGQRASCECELANRVYRTYPMSLATWY
jgi:hypothetical protein